MALGRNQLFMVVGVAGAAALFYGYTIYQENPDLTLGDLANLEKMKNLVASPKPSLVDQQKGKVMAKLDEARRAQAEREESMAQQTGESNLGAVGSSTLDKTPGGGALDAKGAVKAFGAKAAASAASADAALEGKAAPGAPVAASPASPKPATAQASPAPAPGAQAAAPSPPEPAKPRDIKAENDRLLSLVRGMTPAEKAEEAPQKPKLTMVDPEMAHTVPAKAERRSFDEKPGRGKASRPGGACKSVPRDQVLAFLKKEAKAGLGFFAQTWTEKYGPCSDALIAIASDPAQEVGMRYFTLQAALEIGGRDSADGIAKLLKDRNPGIRCLCVLGLGEMGDRELSEKFAPLLKDPAMVVRECALDATVRAQGTESLSQVVAVISDPRNYVKGRPLSIVKRGFDLLDAMGAGTSQQEACNALKEKTGERLFSETTRKWSVCAQSQGG